MEQVYYPPYRAKAQAGYKLEDLPTMLALDSKLNSLAALFHDVIHWERGYRLDIPLLLKRQSNILHARFAFGSKDHKSPKAAANIALLVH